MCPVQAVRIAVRIEGATIIPHSGNHETCEDDFFAVVGARE
jgi:hypothetical protein